MNPPSNRRTLSNSGASRLSTSGLVSKPLGGLSNNTSGGRHPLRSSWTISYVHRPPTVKIVEYEKEIKRVASFGSIESFFSIYAHLTPASELPPVTDILLFVSRIARPIWEELPRGGKFTLRLLKPVSPLLFESLILALIGDQFDDADGVVGCVLSVRANNEDALSIWTEDEGDIPAIREKILSLLSLPPSTTCEYKSNRTLLEGASKLQSQAHTPHHERANGGERGHGHHYNGERNGYPRREGVYNRSHRGERVERGERPDGGERERERL